MRSRRSPAVCLPFVVGLVFASCSDRTPEPTPTHAVSPAPSRDRFVEASQVPAVVKDRIQIEPAIVRRVQEIITAPGEVTLDLKRVAKVAPRIEGRVERLHASLGDPVRSGQPLASIGGPRMDELVQDYLVAKTQAETTENNFRRTQKLSADGIAPERRLVEERGRYLEAKTRYQHMREKLLSLGLSTGELRELERASHEESHRYVLKSPITGTLVKQNVVLGQGVSPGSELFEVVDTSQVWVFANLPMEQARRFKVGDIGTIIAKGGEPVKASLSYVAPIADETTRTIRIRFEISNPHNRLNPNEYVDVQMAYEGLPVLSIPASAITLVEKTRGVFVPRGTGYAFVPIEIGREGGGWAEVRKGLSEGDRVVSEGVFDLKNLLLKEAIQAGEGE